MYSKNLSAALKTISTAPVHQLVCYRRVSVCVQCRLSEASKSICKARVLHVVVCRTLSTSVQNILGASVLSMCSANGFCVDQSFLPQCASPARSHLSAALAESSEASLVHCLASYSQSLFHGFAQRAQQHLCPSPRALNSVSVSCTRAPVLLISQTAQKQISDAPLCPVAC